MTQLDYSSRVAHFAESSQDAYEMDSAEPSSSADKMAQLLRGKEKEWTAVVEKKRPLRLLDLPVDVLKEIIKEVTHTNDLTSLALTHSALHDLAIPYIYSRFDIVWPETQVTTDTRTGVDALTYGLSTLVMSEEVFSDPSSSEPENMLHLACRHCGKLNFIEGHLEANSKVPRKRKGNNFAQYTRKFSLGNGDPDWVQEYLISKESGKMLGTLVALAVARMQNLEAFVWDMPTGILRDVWSALSSIGRFRNGDEPRLEKIWVRYHFNKLGLPVAYPQNAEAPTQSQPPIQAVLQGGQTITAPEIHTAVGHTTLPDGSLLATSYRNVEHPSFSILPPLRSFTVLEIDEPAYLVEMSVLVERSIDRLRELRIGLASLAYSKRWPAQDQIPISATSTFDTRVGYIASGGPLGMIMSRLYDCRPGPSIPPGGNVHSNTHHTKQVDAELVANDTPHMVPDMLQHSLTHGVNYSFIDTTPNLEESIATTATLYPSLEVVETVTSVAPVAEAEHYASPASSLLDPMLAKSVSSIASHELPANNISHRFTSTTASQSGSIRGPSSSMSTHKNRSTGAIANYDSESIPRQRKLRLEILELERVPLSVRVLQKTIDWTVLTSLTLLNCESDEELWKALKRTYTPRLSLLFDSEPTPKPVGSVQHKRSLSIPSSEFPLRLKKLHTNNVSAALIAFLKEALAPNTLEWLFLQDGPTPGSKVTVDAIFRGPLRRHRGSLKKVMIDSGPKRSGDSTRGTRWKRWIFNREVLSFITGGKMPRLRELAMAMDYKDWHFFLQRLPQIPHLRSLYVPNLADHVHGHQIDARELALQVVDIVTLRPEIELCYMGITTKCFEILEQKHIDNTLSASHDLGAIPANGGATVDTDDDSDIDNDNDDDEDGASDNHGHAATTGEQGADESDSPDDSDTNTEDDTGSEDGSKRTKLKLREILFYDDKVSIFKARHGQL